MSSEFNSCTWEDFNDGVEPKFLGLPADGVVQYYDDISGAPLPTELVENAIKEEMAEYAKHAVYRSGMLGQDRRQAYLSTASHREQRR